MSTMALLASVGQLDADGVDQAKFRTPKVKTKSHRFGELVRPALHIQGTWMHGVAYHLAIADADMMKNTNNNVDTLARCLSYAYGRFSGQLPLGLVLMLDNTWRENRNGKMLKWIVALVGLGVFRWVAFAFFQVGHTHGPLDGTFGQLCVKLSFAEWDDDQECVQLLNRLLTNLGVDKGSRLGAMAYKLDETADWEEWWNQVPAHFSNLCGPEAPNYFRVCRRGDIGLLDMHSHLGKDELACEVDHNFDDGTVPCGEDIMVVIKPRISSMRVTQVAEVMPAKSLRLLTRIAQPRGIGARRHLSMKTREDIVHHAEKVFAAHAISQKARDYLVKWAEGTLARAPRPESYAFLQHRWAAHGQQPNTNAPPIPHDPTGLRRLKAKLRNPNQHSFSKPCTGEDHGANWATFAHRRSRGGGLRAWGLADTNGSHGGRAACLRATHMRALWFVRWFVVFQSMGLFCINTSTNYSFM